MLTFNFSSSLLFPNVWSIRPVHGNWWFEHLPLSYRLPDHPTATARHANAPHMIAAKHNGRNYRQQQPERCIVAVGNMSARKVGDRRHSVQNASAVAINAGVQHIFPMVPCNGRRHAAHKPECNHQRIQIGQPLFASMRIQRHCLWCFACVDANARGTGKHASESVTTDWNWGSVWLRVLNVSGDVLCAIYRVFFPVPNREFRWKGVNCAENNRYALAFDFK